MIVLVAGATGALGTAIVRLLRARDHSVVALVRTSSEHQKVADFKKLGISIVYGDLKDADTLTRACGNVDAVISTVTMVLTAQPGDSFAATDGAGTKNLIDASRAAGVGHFVFVSFDTSVVPDCPLASAKKEAEEHLIHSGLTYTILHPTPFMESW
ncbi:MAG: NAD(P)H-binding protein, partial [Gemmatimonadota bacterium]